MPKRLRRTTIDVVAVTSLLGAPLAAVGLTPRAAHAATMTTVEVFNLHRDLVMANFDNTEGCIHTTAVVTAFNAATLSFSTPRGPVTPPGGPQPTSFTIVELNQFDNCTGFDLLNGDGITTDPTAISLHVGPNLSTATLVATVPFTNEVTGESFNLAVNLTWNATAPVVRQASRFHEVDGNIIINGHVVAPTRDAVATGTISGNGTNFTPAPSVPGQVPTQIMKSTSGEITITRG